MKLALYGIHQNLPKIDPSARLVAAIHDEVLVEAPRARAIRSPAMAKEQMLQAGAEILGQIPLEADGGVGEAGGGQGMTAARNAFACPQCGAATGGLRHPW